MFPQIFLLHIWGHVALSVDSVLPQDLKSILILIRGHLLISSSTFLGLSVSTFLLVPF